MHFNLVTIFPELIQDFVSYGIISNAISKNRLSISTWNPREYSEDKNGSSAGTLRYGYGGDA